MHDAEEAWQCDDTAYAIGVPIVVSAVRLGVGSNNESVTTWQERRIGSRRSNRDRLLIAWSGQGVHGSVDDSDDMSTRHHRHSLPKLGRHLGTA